MEVEIEFTKNAQKNAEDYFEKSKRSRRKAEGAEKAIKELEEALGKLEGKAFGKKEVRTVERREWYEKFNWFFASDGSLVIGGRSADQNDELYSKYFEDKDLFFHSDIHGASAVILKDGVSSGKEVGEEAAQFAASFSSAWEMSHTTVDVYSLRKEQVTKGRNEGALGKGSFLLKGEREWYKNSTLELVAFFNEKMGKVEVAPLLTGKRLGLKRYVVLSVGKTKKSDAAKYISRELGYPNVDYIMQHIPTGPFALKSVSE
ncbi:MAG TPA: NFACT RNA binding domain-containing protein [Candidatus Saccharimonadales bacterium]|nr:NFACT RNA binding domain-containing protein [Candidatus Saccharimonadales bacterium]